MASYGTAKGSKTCACGGMQKMRILEVRGRWFVNARSSDFSSHTRYSARQHSAEAPCTLCRIRYCTHGSLHLGTLQRHLAPSAEFIAAPATPAPWNRRVTAAEFLKCENEREYIHCCTYGTLHRGTLQWHPTSSAESSAALLTISTIELCCSELWLWTVNFWARELGANHSRLFVQIHPPKRLLRETFLPKSFLPENFFTRKLLPECYYTWKI